MPLKLQLRIIPEKCCHMIGQETFDYRKCAAKGSQRNLSTIGFQPIM